MKTTTGCWPGATRTHSANGAPADLVIGQPDFLSSGCNATSAASLCKPTGVAVDASGNLYVADGGNSRVLEYTNPFTACAGVFPCVGGPASLVFGQGGSFTSNTCDSDTEDSGSTSIDLCSPIGVAVDASGNLYVADSGNNRVLEYNTPLTADVTAIHGLRPGRKLHCRIAAISTPSTAAPPPWTCALRPESRWTRRAISTWRTRQQPGAGVQHPADYRCHGGHGLWPGRGLHLE